MPCHAMHPIQDLFLESFSYALQFDMHSYVGKNFILVKSGCYIFLSEVMGILVSYLSLYYPCYQDLGRILVIFYIILSLPSLGITMEIG
jgi:hypothetical protein